VFRVKRRSYGTKKGKKITLEGMIEKKGLGGAEGRRKRGRLGVKIAAAREKAAIRGTRKVGFHNMKMQNEKSVVKRQTNLQGSARGEPLPSRGTLVMLKEKKNKT